MSDKDQLDRIEGFLREEVKEIKTTLYHPETGLCRRIVVMETERKDDRRSSNTVLAWMSVGIASIGGLFEFLKK